MISFQRISIQDRDRIQSFFDRNTFRNCDFSFSNIFSWQHLYDTSYAVWEERFLLIHFYGKDKQSSGYLFPLGDDDLKEAILLLQEDAAARNEDFRLYAVTEEMFRLLDAAFPDQFVYTPEEDWFEYLYNSEDLIRLVGKKFQAKRNHINKFKRTYNWEYVPITEEIISDCMILYDRWCKENGNCNTEKMLIEERIATQKVFDNFAELKIKGGALRINGEILAYSYGQPLTADTFGVHAEKSLYEIDGGFTMINQQFAEHNCGDYKYINREEDLGIESLRKAKMSYHPALLLKKGTVTLKR